MSSPLGMGTNQEIRKRPLPLTASKPINAMGFAGSKSSLKGYGFAFHVEPGQSDR